MFSTLFMKTNLKKPCQERNGQAELDMKSVLLNDNDNVHDISSIKIMIYNSNDNLNT